MLRIETLAGPLHWNLGQLNETAETIFCYGYSAEFARSLYLRMLHLTICYFESEDRSPDHFFCSDGQFLYDILGRQEIASISRSRTIVENLSLQELEQHIPCYENCALAESVIDEYLDRYCS